ncbi:hypothetical protein CYLTODRAFT_423832 [Cylindrobasidium torrendii FP15055 ss-10]|uniref:Stealth protein CR3 conserved region 3 domain-containing protein n=1 Tax=Cylindrobasidium torrendii FP15055 ss-10 TaxID=1314674 RepID=A0A0D7B673_9AGAR|nr:hypothetical protein CYLTODRAFT_423832 [Cylindrobasidium torrendii FP15055 ss-10]
MSWMTRPAPDRPNVVAQLRARKNMLVVVFTIALVLSALILLDYPLQPLATSIDHDNLNFEPVTIHESLGSASIVDFDNSKFGVTYHLFNKTEPKDMVANHTILPMREHLRIPDDCLDTWISWGQWEGPCADAKVDESRIDLVWIWVNGSDPLHRQSRNEYVLAATGQAPKNARFREHDELRHSFRSALKSSPTWRDSNWHLVTADVPHFTDEDKLLGLVPQWLDLNHSITPSEHQQPPIHLHHVSQIFKLVNNATHAPTEEEAQEWREQVLPNFNSFGVESQLSNMDPQLVSDNIVALNDDHYMMLSSPPATFHTPLYGPVLRFDRAFPVKGDPSGSAAGDGEWRSLGWSAYLLNERFGTRRRSYVLHNPRSLSLPLLHEASLAFGAQFSATPLSRFRGWHDVPGEFEVNTIFTATHFMIERRREALLWSWIVAKWGGRNDGTLSLETKENMWVELGGDYDTTGIPMEDLRTYSPAEVNTNLELAGLQPPTSTEPTETAHTNYLFVSQNGYPTFLNGLPLPQSLQRDKCLGWQTQSAWDLFRDVLSVHPQCGDAIIAALLKGTDAGLAVFLPDGPVESDPADPYTLPLELPLDAPPLPRSPRAFAVRLIHRYSFVIGETSTRFFGVGSLGGAKWLLGEVDQGKDLVLVCVNDDLPDDSGEDEFTLTDAFIREWQESRWPDKLDREIQ